MGISKNTDDEDLSKNDNSFLDKDLDAALDSFDNLFCRRCLVRILYVVSLVCCFVLTLLQFNCSIVVSFWQVFDCRLHGCSQDLVFPVSKCLIAV